MKTIISYGLFNTKINTRKPFKFYSDILKRNAEIYEEILPNSTMVLYYDETVPNDILEFMQSKNVVLKKQNISRLWEGTLWRFKELNNSNENTIVILQDADSPLDVENNLLPKLRNILKNSDKKSIIHHGPVSTNKLRDKKKWIMAGQSMFKQNIDLDIDKLIQDYLNIHNEFDSDEIFLSKYIWPIIKDNCLINIERRALPLFLEIIKNNSDTPKWLLDSDYMDRIITNLTEK